jgi:PAS domain S-box-containing protein
LAVVTRSPVSAADALYDPLFAQLPLPAFLVAADLRITSVNTEFERALGLTSETVVGRNAAVLFVRDDLPRLVSLLGRLRRSEVTDDQARWDLNGPDGAVMRAQIRMRSVDLDGTRFSLAVLVDVRRRDCALQSNFEPGLLFSALFDDAVLPMTLQDCEWRYREVNAAFCTLVGYTRDELLGHDPILLMPDDVHGRVQAQRSLADGYGDRGVIHDRPLRRKNGSIVLSRLHFQMIHDAAGHRYVLASLVDLTDEIDLRRRVEKQARSMEQLFELAPVGFVMRDEQHRILRVNRAFAAMSGYAPGDLIGRIDSFSPDATPRATDVAAVRAVPRAASMPVASMLPEAQAAGEAGHGVVPDRGVDTGPGAGSVSGVALDADPGTDPGTDPSARPGAAPGAELGAGSGAPLLPLGAVARARIPLLSRDGRRLLTDRISTQIEDLDGRRVRLTAISDVTQESQLEEELKRLVMQQGALLRTMSAGVMMVVDGRVIRCNASLENLLGLPAERIVSREVGDVVHADMDWQRIMRDAADVLAADSTYRCEVELRRHASEPIVCALQLRLIDSALPEQGLIVTLHDITDLKRQQARLIQANAELGTLIENTAVAIAYLDRDSVVRCNHKFESLLGVRPGELAGRAFGDFVLSGEAAGSSLLSLLAEHPSGSHTLAVRLKRTDGLVVDCLAHLGAIDKVRWPDAAILIVVDMSGQQAALSALAESQERFGRFAEAVDEAVFVIDGERGSALYANSRFGRVLGVSAEEFYQSPAAAWTHVDAEDRPALEALLAPQGATDQHHELDVRIDLPGNGRRTVRLRLFPGRAGSGELYFLAEDVTEIRSMAQRRLEDAIQQRDTLVREVHHRIKNNLQGVAGLLQQSAARRPEIAIQLEEIVGQIQAIAQVHGLQVRDKGDLSLARIARAVFDNLGRSFGRSIQYPIGAFTALERWSIPEQEAVPVALVINELGTNAIKHSDPARVVEAQLVQEDTTLILRIRNSGQLPDGFSFERLAPSPSGLGLIKALLPRRGTRLTLMPAADGTVVAELQIGAPVIRHGATG